MQIIEPYFIIETPIDGEYILKRVEKAGRTAYKTEDKITVDSAKKFVKKILDMGHESVIKPCFWNSDSAEDKEKFEMWEEAMKSAEKAYLKLMELGALPQEARSVLPNSLKTEIVMTMNLREWRHFFKLRTAETAHPQMREIARPLLDEFKKQIPVIFDNIKY